MTTARRWADVLADAQSAAFRRPAAVRLFPGRIELPRKSGLQATRRPGSRHVGGLSGKTCSAPSTAGCEAVTAPFKLTLDEQRALIAFAERQASLSAERRLELASILAEPLATSDQEAEAKIHGIARSLMGAA